MQLHGHRHQLLGRRKQPRLSFAKCLAASLRPRSGFIDPVHRSVTVSAPATVANLGPGFDWLGCAVEVWQLQVTQLFPAVLPAASNQVPPLRD